MKKILTFIISAAMVLTLAVPVMASDGGFHIGSASNRNDTAVSDAAGDSGSFSMDDLSQLFEGLVNSGSASEAGTADESADLSQLFAGLFGSDSASEESTTDESADLSQLFAGLFSSDSASGDGTESGSVDLSQILQGLMGAASEDLKEDASASEILGVIGSLFSGDSSEDNTQLKEFMSGLGNQIAGAISDAGENASQNLGDLSGTLQESLSNILGSVSDSTDDIKGSLGDLLGALSASFSDAADGQESAGELTGGWEVNYTYEAEMDNDVRNVFDKAMEGQEKGRYDAVALLATQVVAGTNYAFLCSGDPEFTEADPEWHDPAWYIITIYANLKGEAEVISMEEINLGDIQEGDIANVMLTGAWTIQEPEKPVTTMPEDAQAAFDAATEGLAGVGYQPIVLLGTQVAAGTNYKILCYGSLVTQDPIISLYVMDIYQDPAGSAGISDIQIFDLTAYINN